jgi:hypothetical protein
MHSFDFQVKLADRIVRPEAAISVSAVLDIDGIEVKGCGGGGSCHLPDRDAVGNTRISLNDIPIPW